MKRKTIKRQVRIPADWLKLAIDDIMIDVVASINDTGEEVGVMVKQITFPGWHCFNIKPGHQLQAYELIEQKCIDEDGNPIPLADRIKEKIKNGWKTK